MSRIESFSRMFDSDTAHGSRITKVEIPLIQRDYAQGRRGEKVDEIRRNFLRTLHDALTGDNPRSRGLDFIYGELKEDGTLQPLDGQQRLTTLFLLHWYLASRADKLKDASTWLSFSYETRPSARRFCERLVAATPPADYRGLSEWVQQQPWYLFVWRYDPTINSMLVMIDAIDEQFAEVEATQAWDRLTDVQHPAVWFHLLPLPDMGSSEDLYVKMNSRGKPLTDFENFKARFEKIIGWSNRAKEFAHKADTAWADVLWQFRGEDDLVDDEFLRYFEFVTEVCEWNDDQLGSGAGRSITYRATSVFGPDNPRCAEHLDFLFEAFDVWVGRDIQATFDALFHNTSSSGAETKDSLPLFFREANPNLFESACHAYGVTAGSGNRNFTFGQTMLLLAVVLQLSKDAEDCAPRLRTLRNLIEGSQFEMRAERMPRLIADTRALIENGDLPQPGNTFAVAQISDEADKRQFVAEYPEAASAMAALEDNYVLKGSTTAFILDPSKIASHQATFETLMSDPDLWWDLTGALLTVGDYQWPRERNGTLESSDAFQFGTWDGKYSDAWREVLVGRTRAGAESTAKVLGSFLDAVIASSAPLGEALRQMQTDWLRERDDARTLDWRYYLVKYPAARAGASGLYYAHGRRMGFSLTNLPGGRKYRNANYRDPYLLSIFEVANKPAEVAPASLWFSGYEWEPRWLRLKRSGVGLRSVPRGFQIMRPADDEFREPFELVASELGMFVTGGDDTSVFIDIAKAADDPNGPDAEDRIQLGARILARFIATGL